MTLLLSSCATGQALAPPKVASCVLVAEKGELDCYDPNMDEHNYQIGLSFSQDYVCFGPESLRQLMTWIRLRSHE